MTRDVKKFLSSRLIMNSRRLWNSHQWHKFLRAEASRDILKVRVSAIAFPGVFKRYLFHRGRHVVLTEYTQEWEQCLRNFPRVHDIARFERFTDLNLFKYAFNVIDSPDMTANFWAYHKMPPEPLAHSREWPQKSAKHHLCRGSLVMLQCLPSQE